MAKGPPPPRPVPRPPTEYGRIPPPPREPREQASGGRLHGWPLAALVILGLAGGCAAVAMNASWIRFVAAGACR